MYLPKVPSLLLIRLILLCSFAPHIPSYTENFDLDFLMYNTGYLEVTSLGHESQISYRTLHEVVGVANHIHRTAGTDCPVANHIHRTARIVCPGECMEFWSGYLTICFMTSNVNTVLRLL